jgi:hypothetical protein
MTINLTHDNNNKLIELCMITKHMCTNLQTIWIEFEWHPLVPTHDEVGCSPTAWGGLDRWPAFEIHRVILHKLWDLISSQWILLVHRIHSNPQINFVIRLILDISRHCGCNTKDFGIMMGYQTYTNNKWRKCSEKDKKKKKETDFIDKNQKLSVLKSVPKFWFSKNMKLGLQRSLQNWWLAKCIIHTMMVQRDLAH